MKRSFTFIRTFAVAVFTLLFLGSFAAMPVWSAKQHILSGNINLGYVAKQLWEGAEENLIPEEIESCEALQYALSNPDSEEGKAWISAWNNRRGNTDYIGSEDNKPKVIDNLAGIIDLDDSYSYIVKLTSTGYELYVVHENLNDGNHRLNQTVQNVTKTTYKQNADDSYTITETTIGQATIHWYYITNRKLCINTDSFKAY